MLASEKTFGQSMQWRLQNMACFCVLLALFFSPISISLTNIGISLAAFLSLLAGQFKQRFSVHFSNPFLWLSLLLFFYVLLGTLWGTTPWVGKLSALHKYGKLLYIFFLLPLFVEEKWQRWGINTFLLAMVITVVLAFGNYWHWWQLGPIHSGDGVFHSHIETSYFVAFSAYIFAVRAWGSGKQRWLYGVLWLAFTFYEFFINQGRTGYLVYSVLAVLFFCQYIKSWRVFFALVGVGILLVVLAFFAHAEVIQKLLFSFKNVHGYFGGGSKNTSLGYRLQFAKLSWHFIKQRPFFGFGTGSFAYLYAHYGHISGWGSVLAPKASQATLHTPHNDFLLIAVELGLLGALLLIYFFYKQWRMSFVLPRYRHEAQALVLSFVVVCCCNASLYTSVTGYFYVLFASLIFATWRGASLKSSSACKSCSPRL